MVLEAKHSCDYCNKQITGQHWNHCEIRKQEFVKTKDTAILEVTVTVVSPVGKEVCKTCALQKATEFLVGLKEDC